jgi:protein TonB
MEERLLPSLTRPGDRRILWTGFWIAVALHGAVMMLHLPKLDRDLSSTKREEKVIVVRRYVPPPPTVQRPRRVTAKKRNTRKIPLPDPTPDAPEPIREPEPEITVDLDALLSDTADLLGDPVAPPTGARGGGNGGDPLLAGVGGVTEPVRIEESYVRPEYPEIARRARLEGQVIVQAVIRCDGTVGETNVLRCTQQHVGFEEAAIAAVCQWRYEPAMQYGHPVAVYFNIIVDFTLL